MAGKVSAMLRGIEPVTAYALLEVSTIAAVELDRENEPDYTGTFLRKRLANRLIEVRPFTFDDLLTGDIYGEHDNIFSEVFDDVVTSITSPYVLDAQVKAQHVGFFKGRPRGKLY